MLYVQSGLGWKQLLGFRWQTFRSRTAFSSTPVEVLLVLGGGAILNTVAATNFPPAGRTISIEYVKL
jgi:hypothetical protein